MNRKEFAELLHNKILILDGATGTQLQKKGMPQGVCPEKWVLENPEVIKEVQREYAEAGSNAVYACTFGGNRVKLSEFGLADRVEEINCELVKISKSAVPDNVLVAGDISPTGKIMEPFGDASFEDTVEIYKEQVRGLLKGGADFIVVETMMDIQEARAAIIAIRDTSEDIPVCVSMTYGENGRTMMGTEAKTAAIILEALGADAIGCNCSTGPENMLKTISEIKKVTSIPVLAKPNAGMPKLVDGKTVFDMEPCQYGQYARAFSDEGVSLLGGCCGTSPEYIKAIVDNLGDKKNGIEKEEFNISLSNGRNAYLINNLENVSIGNSINVNINSELLDEVKSGDMDLISELAMNEMDDEVNIICLDLYYEGADEESLIKKAIVSITPLVNVPIAFKCHTAAGLKAALRTYPGKACVYTFGESELYNIALKYGAVILD